MNSYRDNEVHDYIRALNLDNEETEETVKKAIEWADEHAPKASNVQQIDTELLYKIIFSTARLCGGKIPAMKSVISKVSGISDATVKNMDEVMSSRNPY